MELDISNTQEKSAFIAIVGRPNVGKSSLLNSLLGEKVAIVTPKPQTTRTSITGILTEGETQLVFIDTPGLLRPRNALGRYMVKSVDDSVADVELAVLVTEPSDKPELAPAEQELIADFAKRGLRAIAVINKIDTLGGNTDVLLPLMARLGAAYSFDEIIPMSVLAGDGVAEFRSLLMRYAKPSPHFFPDDEFTDQPERVICAELIREKALECLSDELPHGIAITIEEMKERDSGIIDIQAVIYCEKDSHKGMIIGKGGAMLKRIGSLARADIEEFLDAKVNLQCWVKVKEDWRNQERYLRNFGFN